jgi:N-acetylglutamate synthase-like GNAT family acetyltransferase
MIKVVQKSIAKEIVKTDSFLTFDDNTNFFGYYLNDVLAGIIGYKISKNKVRIKSWTVLKQYRNKGIGEKLLSFVLNIGDDFDCFATTYSYNLFKRKGFQDVKKYKNGVTYMRLKKC